MKVPSLRNQGARAHPVTQNAAATLLVSCHPDDTNDSKSGWKESFRPLDSMSSQDSLLQPPLLPSTLLFLSLPHAAGEVCMWRCSSYSCSVLMTSQAHLNDIAHHLWLRKLRHKENEQFASVPVNGSAGTCFPDWKLILADSKVLTISYTAPFTCQRPRVSPASSRARWPPGLIQVVNVSLPQDSKGQL